MILIFNLLPIKSENNNLNFNLLFIIFLLGLSIFSIFWGRFFSFRKFSIIRSKRSVTQILSYELGIIFILIFLILIFINFNIRIIIIKLYKIKFIKLILIIIIFLLILRETSRIPFDFIERESELISGFNTEYSRIYFSLFFVFEYGIILFFRIFIRIIYFNFFFSLILIFLFIHLRSSFPRIRYDQIIIFI